MQLLNVLSYVVLGFIGIIAIRGVLAIKRPLLFAVLGGNIVSLGISLYLLNIPSLVILITLLSFEVYQLGKTAEKKEEEEARKKQEAETRKQEEEKIKQQKERIKQEKETKKQEDLVNLADQNRSGKLFYM